MKKITASKAKGPIAVHLPEEITVTFDSIIGLKDAKKELQDVINYVTNKDYYSNVLPHMHYLICGPDGVGKSSLAFALARECKIPVTAVNCLSFTDTRRSSLKLLEKAFKTAKSSTFGLLFLKNFENLFTINESYQTYFLNTLVQYMREYTNVIVIATVSVCIEFGESLNFLFDEDTFSKTIELEEPTIEEREKMFKLFSDSVSNVKFSEQIDYHRLALDTYGMTAKDIKRIIKNATLISMRDTESENIVTHECIENVITTELMGQELRKLSEKERKATAYHEAGHVVAGYFADPQNYKLSKVEVMHRSDTLGVTIHESDEDKMSEFKSDYENRITSCFGGLIAERMVFYENTDGVSQDLVMATTYAKMMVGLFGMSDVFGPRSTAVVEPFDNLNSSEKLIETFDKEVDIVLEKQFKRCKKILEEHFTELKILAERLFEKEVVYGNEIKEIFEKSEK